MASKVSISQSNQKLSLNHASVHNQRLSLNHASVHYWQQLDQGFRERGHLMSINHVLLVERINDRQTIDNRPDKKRCFPFRLKQIMRLQATFLRIPNLHALPMKTVHHRATTRGEVIWQVSRRLIFQWLHIHNRNWCLTFRGVTNFNLPCIMPFM